MIISGSSTIPNKPEFNQITSCNSTPADVTQGGNRDAIWPDSTDGAFFDRRDSSGMLAARANDRMYPVTGGLLSAVFVWLALIGNTVIRCQDSPKKKRVIETLDYAGDVNSKTEVPVELLPALEPDFEPLCDICPECFVCTEHHRLSLQLPPRLASHKDFFIFYSYKGHEFTDGMNQLFVRGMMEKLLWRAGVQPLRFWTQDCVAVTSLFGSLIQACSCDYNPPPPKFQVLVGGFKKWLDLSNEEILCDEIECIVTIDAADSLVWYTTDTTLEKNAMSRPKFLNLPRLDLHIQAETISHVLKSGEEGVEQSYYAVNRTEIHMMHGQIKESLQRDDEYWFTDINQIFADKIDNKVKKCYNIGGRKPLMFTFNNYFREKKTR